MPACSPLEPAIRSLTAFNDKSNASRSAFVDKLEIRTRDVEFDRIYVNGDNYLENLRRPDETWKVRLIEEESMRLMFDVQDL
jgi:adenine-specific DNA-methyltransferase